MPFNSYIFILGFLPIVCIGYYLIINLKNKNLPHWWLILCSWIFYGYYVPQNLPIFLGSIFFNFLFLEFLYHAEDLSKKRVVFFISLILNLIFLGFFKYTPGIILPIGISFYTVSQIAMLIDAYQGMKYKKTFTEHVLMLSFFPALLAGPIAQFKEMLPQFQNQELKKFNINFFTLGIYLFCLGLAKKVLISDMFAPWANPGFEETAILDFFGSWKTSLSYTFQLYFDFSGYSDMAMGLGYLFNFKLPNNFNSPLAATNLIDFWNRWHMTLSRFIRNYIFTPIAQSLPSMDFSYIMLATFLSMCIAGIWHGSGWTFLLYGAVHGLGLVINHLWKKRKIKMPSFLSWMTTFLFVNFSFVLFRSPSLENSRTLFKGMLGLNGVIVPKVFGIKKLGFFSKYGFSSGNLLQPEDYLILISMITFFITIYKAKNTFNLAKEFTPKAHLAVWSSLLFVLSLFGLNRVTEFIYFNF